MKYVGVDLHKHVIVLCVVEATAAYEWFFQLIEDRADRLVLAHPKKLRVIAESTRKSDKIDAEVLGVFLARDMVGRSVEAMLQQWELFQRQRFAADQQLAEFAAAAPLAECEARAILDSIPQIGPVTIDVVLSELGDWRRFRSQSAVARFAGLDPGFRFERLESNTGSKKKAIVGVARRLLCVMFAMLQSGQPYRLLEPASQPAVQKRRKPRRTSARARKAKGVLAGV